MNVWMRTTFSLFSHKFDSIIKGGDFCSSFTDTVYSVQLIHTNRPFVQPTENRCHRHWVSSRIVYAFKFFFCSQKVFSTFIHQFFHHWIAMAFVFNQKVVARIHSLVRTVKMEILLEWEKNGTKINYFQFIKVILIILCSTVSSDRNVQRPSESRQTHAVS